MYSVQLVSQLLSYWYWGCWKISSLIRIRGWPQVMTTITTIINCLLQGTLIRSHCRYFIIQSCTVTLSYPPLVLKSGRKDVSLELRSLKVIHGVHKLDYPWWVILWTELLSYCGNQTKSIRTFYRLSCNIRQCAVRKIHYTQFSG